MNHQPFEGWLLADNPPEGEQAIELREHLRDCSRCRQLEADWSGIHQLIQTSGQITPAPGFSARWQARLLLKEQLAQNRRQHRQPWLLFVINFSIAALLLVLLGSQLWKSFHSTAQLLLVKAFLLSIVLFVIETGQEILTTSIQVAVQFPVVLWAFLLGMSGFLGMLWITVGRQIVSTRRVTL